MAGTPRTPKTIRKTIDALPVVDDQYLPTLLQLLDHARERVLVAAFSFASSSRGRRKDAGPSAPRRIADKLVELARRGVDVRLYVEDRRDTAERNRPTAELLASGGVKVTYGSSHAKGVCVDGRYVLFGSTNFTEQSLTKNIETNLFFDDARVAAGFERYFLHLEGGGRQGSVVLDPPLIADGGFEEAIVEAADAATSRIDFSIYFFDDAPIEQALARARSRGVLVRGLVHTHATFALSYVRRTRRTAERLHAAGVEDLHFGPPHQFTHSKFLVRDRKEILLGTGNWLREDVEIHPQLYVRFTNARVAKQLVDHLDRTIRERATPFA